MTVASRKVRIFRAYDRLLDVLAYGAAFLLFAIMVGTGLDVGARYLLNSPIGWMTEFVQHSLLLMLFLGIGWLTRERGHVAIEIFLDAAPKRFRRGMRIVAFLISGSISGFVGWWAAVAALDSYTRDVLTEGIYPIPRYWLISVISVGLLLTAIEFFRSAVALLKDPNAEISQFEAELEALAAHSIREPSSEV